MRLRNTREFMQDRREFVYMYRVEIAQIMALTGIEYKEQVLKFIERFARPILGYKANTLYSDIFNTFKKDFFYLQI